MKKRLLAIFLAISMMVFCLFGATACSGKSDSPNNNFNQGDNTGDNTGDNNSHSHNYIISVLAPTCMEKGYTLHKCSCGDEYKDSFIEATGIHIFSNYTFNDDATCTEDGTEMSKCDTCSEFDVRTKENTALGTHLYNNFICSVCNNLDPLAPVSEGLQFTEIIKNEKIIGYSVSVGQAKNDLYIKIPDEHLGKPVTKLDAEAFKNCSMKTIYIPDSITHIGNYAFSICENLESIIIPNSISIVGRSILFGCNSLTSLTLPFTGYSVNSQYPLGYLFGTTSYNEAYSVTQYEKSTSDKSAKFYVPKTLRYVSITGNSMHYNAFRNCNSLRDVELSDNIINISEDAFANCIKLSNITIPNSVTEIGPSAFSGCTDLTSIIIPGSVKNVGSYAFSGCSNLTKVNLGEGIETIGNGVFGSYSFTTDTLTIPDSVVELGDCDNIIVRDLILGKGLRKIGSFYQSIIDNIYFRGDITKWCGIEQDGISSKKLYIDGNLLTGNLVLPRTVKEINGRAFYARTELASITIPSSVERIINYAFDGCRNLTVFCELASKPDGWDHYWNYDVKETDWDYKNYGQNSNLSYSSYITIVNGIKYRVYPSSGWCTIPTEQSSDLKYLKIPAQITFNNEKYDVGFDSNNYSLSFMKSLSYIEVDPNNKKVSSLNGVLYNKDKTELLLVPSSYQGDVVIPNTVTKIKRKAIYHCNAVSRVFIPSSVEVMYSDCFNSYDTRVIVYSEVAKKPNGWENGWNGYSTKITTVWDYKNNDVAEDGYIYTIIDGILYKIKEGKASVGKQISSICGKIQIPSNINYNGAEYAVESIVDKAFEDCQLLESVEIHDSVKNIGTWAFYNCSSLKSVIIGKNVEIVSNDAFRRCDKLSSIKVLGTQCSNLGLINLFSLNYNEYEGCLYLGNDSNPYLMLITVKNKFAKSYRISPNTKVIADGAFSNCEDLTSITIPSGVTKMGAGVFSSCTNLEQVNWNAVACSSTNAIFTSCQKLSQINIGNNVKILPSYVFAWCEGLTSINIPNNVTSIGDSAFRDCRNLTSIKIPNSVTSIGEYAFSGCNGLTIYCEAESQPNDWSYDWNYSNCPIVWGYEEKKLCIRQTITHT